MGNDPADIKLSISGIELSNEQWILDDGYDKDDALIDHIRDWIEKNKVGHEVGEHNPDPANPNNTVSRDHVPNNGDVKYWVYGQNCGWWASEMLTDLGLWPSHEEMEQIKDFNMGVGPFSRYSDNKVLRSRYGSEKANRFESLKRLFGGGSRYPADLRPEDVYPIKIQPGPFGVMQQVK